MADNAQHLENVARLERVSATREASFARTLRDVDPSWGTQVFTVADGVGVLMGHGLFVNRAMAIGLSKDVTDEELTIFEQRYVTAGVQPAIEVTPATLPAVIRTLEEQGYQPQDSQQVVWMSLESSDPAVPENDSHLIEIVRDADGLSVWEATAGRAWGHTDAVRRRASDAFARTAHRADEPGLLLARSRTDGRVLGCATLAVAQGTALLGGMSTLPDERGHGVQASLIQSRLKLATDLGASEAVSMAEPESGSERNLLRAGFTRSHRKYLWAKSG